MVATMPVSSQIYDLGLVTRIPLGEGRTFRVGHTAVAVFCTREGEVFATQASCSHKGAPLADGIVGSGKLLCPLHACEFDLTTGQPLLKACHPLKTYPVFLDEADHILLQVEAGQVPLGER